MPSPSQNRAAMAAYRQGGGMQQQADILAGQMTAQMSIGNLAKQKLGEQFSDYGAAFLNRMGRGFDISGFVARIKSAYPILLTNDVPTTVIANGAAVTNTPRQIITNAAGTLYQPAQWVHKNQADRWRIIVAVGIKIDASAADGTVGNLQIPLGNANDIAAKGQVTTTKRDRTTTEQFPYLGTIPIRQFTGADGTGNAPIDMASWWNILCPNGVKNWMEDGLVFDLLQPNEQFTMTLAGPLVGTAPTTTKAMHGTLYGVGFDIVTG